MTPNRPHWKTHETTKFDSVDHQVKGLSGNNLVAAVGGTAGGALAYNSFSYGNIGLANFTLEAPTPPDVINTGPEAQINSGQPAFLPLNSGVVAFGEKSVDVNMTSVDDI